MAVSILSPVGNDASPAATAVSWWLWLCWLERDSGGGFVYGCAAPTFRSAGWAEDSVHEISGDGRLIVCERTITGEVFENFRAALDAGTIAPDGAHRSKLSDTRIAATRTVIREALGQSAVRTALYYTLPDVQTLVGTAEGALAAVLSFLQEQLNLPFKQAYAGHLGNFEIFELHPWLDAAQPFLLEATPDPDNDRSRPQTMEICRTPDFAAVPHTAHIVGRVNGEVVFDSLVRLPRGQRRVSIQMPEPLDNFDFRIFSEDGRTLLHSEQRSFLNRIGLVMAPVGGQMTIEDNLSTRAAGRGKALAAQASTVVVHSSHRSMIGAPAAGTWRRFAEDMEQVLAAQIPQSSEDKWFSRGIEGEVGAIAHLNRIIDGGQITRAVLIDAWFGADALSRFVLRLGSQNVHLTIVTSWADIDPDTTEALDPALNPTAKLEATLGQLQPFLAPRLTVINLLDGRSRAFHDRYLLLYPHEGHAKVFQLSNSINKASGNWPFAMSLMAADVSRALQRYIEGLCDGRDTTKNKLLTVSFRWPTNAS
jgi:hypothetical protein